MAPRAAVLVVDDDPAIRGIVSAVCRKLDLEATEAGDGREALACLRQGSFDVVVLDLAMPRFSGFDLLAELRRAPLAELPAVLVLTAGDDPEARRRATELGAIDFLAKPVVLAELGRRIARAVSLVVVERNLGRAQGRLASLRAVDQVTGAGATSQLFAALETELHAAQAGGGPLCCLVFSDEGYDAALSRQGRHAGDLRLRQLAEVLRAELGGAGSLFRVDAAELVVLLPGRPAAEAGALVKRVCAALQNGGPRIEAAAAVAAFPHPEIQQASQLYRAANLTLARARSRGAPLTFEGF